MVFLYVICIFEQTDIIMKEQDNYIFTYSDGRKEFELYRLVGEHICNDIYDMFNQDRNTLSWVERSRIDEPYHYYSLRSILQQHGVNYLKVRTESDLLRYKDKRLRVEDYHYIRADIEVRHMGVEFKCSLRPMRVGSNDEWLRLMNGTDCSDLFLAIRIPDICREGKPVDLCRYYDSHLYACSPYFSYLHDWHYGMYFVVESGVTTRLLFEPVWSGVSIGNERITLSGELNEWHRIDYRNYCNSIVAKDFERIDSLELFAYEHPDTPVSDKVELRKKVEERYLNIHDDYYHVYSSQEIAELLYDAYNS